MARRKSAASASELAEPCANCGAALTGPFCAQCGQKAHLHHKLGHLLEEMVEGVAHFDGRFWRSIPLLVLNPGKLSRDWKEGKRVRYIGPLHLFLFAVFLFFTLPAVTGHHLINLPGATNFRPEAAQPILDEVQADLEANGTNITVNQSTEAGLRFAGALDDRLKNHKYYSYKIEILLYKLSFLLAPISMLILGLLLAFKRNTTFYDHGVVSLYGVGFGFLVLSLFNVSSWTLEAFGWRFTALAPTLIGLALLVHVIAHLKGAYQTSWIGAVARGVVLSGLTAIAFASFVAALVAWGLMG